MANVMSLPAERRETEVSEKAKRRRFGAEYKVRVLHEADACKQVGEISALLRREGLYSSHLVTWRAQARRGPKPKELDARDKQVAEMAREIAKLTRRAERAEALVALQKKLSELLGIALPTLEEES